MLSALDPNDRDAAVLELSMAADNASNLPPQELVGCWVTVEGKGLGRVLAFNKEWMPGTDSKRKERVECLFAVRCCHAVCCFCSLK